MKITLEIPEPKFQKGDVVRYGELILHIYRVDLRGEWCYVPGAGAKAWADDTYRYSVAVQAGKGPVSNPIRPGTVLSYPEQGYSDHQFIDAEKIEWDKPIIEPDNMENLAERQDAWEAQK